MRILIIDDDRRQAAAQAELVRSWGLDARTAHDGATGLDAALEYRPDVMLIDIGLPDMDGCEVAMQVRLNPQARDTRLIAVTSHCDFESRRRAVLAGFDDYFEKPADPDLLKLHLLAVPC